MAIYFRDNEIIEYVNYWMFFITGICYYFSSTLNPILYNVMSEKMRNAFKEIFCGIKPKKSLKRGTFRETSNTYVSMPNSQNNHHPQDLEEDVFISKDGGAILLGQNQRNGKKFTHKTYGMKTETGV